MTIGQRIKKARKNAGMSQKELADKLKVSASMIGQYENDIRKPKYDTQQRIAEALGIDIYEILSNEQRTSLDLGLQFKKLVTVFSPIRTVPFESIYTDKIEHELGLDTDPVWIAGNRLLEAFDKLNDEGQQKAIERVEELTEIPKYKK